MTEHERLRAQLEAAVPDPPVVPGRAARAEAAGRRKRTARRVGGVGTVAAAVIAVVVPVTLGAQDAQRSGAPIATDGSLTGGPTPHDTPDSCREEAQVVDSPAPEGVPAQWIRFCSEHWEQAERYPGEFSPDLTLTRGVDDLVETWANTLVKADRGCPSPFASTDIRLQVGFADGSVRWLTANTADCRPVVLGGIELGIMGSMVMGDTLTAMGEQLAQDQPTVLIDMAWDCPMDPERPETVDHGPLPVEIEGLDFPLPATEGVICRYDVLPDGSYVLEEQRMLSAGVAEQLRVAYHEPATGMADCEPDESRPAYSLVLGDQTGARRAFTLDESVCSTLYPKGLAGTWISQVVPAAWESPKG